MEIVINVSDVMPQITMVAGIIASKNVIPILDNLHFKAYKDGDLEIMASNNETWVKGKAKAEQVNLDGMDDVCFCIEAQLLLQALKNLGNKRLEMVFDTQNKMVTCSYQSGVFKIPYLTGEEYPMPTDVIGDTINVQATNLCTAIGKTKNTVASDTLRPQMNGIHFDFTHDDGMVCVATDAHRLALYKDHSIKFDGETPIDMTLPSNACLMVERNTQRNDGDVKIDISSVNAKFSFNDGTQIITRKVEGRYPNYNAVIPKDGAEQCILMRQPTIDAISRTMVMGSQTTGLTVLDFTPTQTDTFNVSAEDIDFSRSAQESVSCKNYMGGDLKIGFKGTYLLSALSSFDGDDVRLVMNGASHAAIFVPEPNNNNDKDFLYLLMPTVVNNA